MSGPFLAVVWPAARVLARFLLNQPDLARGLEVIEIGCGGGRRLHRSGKSRARKVTANDIDPIALAIASQNAAHNRVSLQFDSENRIETGSIDQAQLLLCSNSSTSSWSLLALADLLEQMERALRHDPHRGQRQGLCSKGLSRGPVGGIGGRGFGPGGKRKEDGQDSEVLS